MDIIQNDKYENNNKLLTGENDQLQNLVKEEKAQEALAELQDRLKEILEEKRDMEIEFIALKKNYIETH